MFLQKTVLDIFEIAPRLGDRHVLMSQLLKIEKVFTTLALKQVF